MGAEIVLLLFAGLVIISGIMNVIHQHKESKEKNESPCNMDALRKEQPMWDDFGDECKETDN